MDLGTENVSGNYLQEIPKVSRITDDITTKQTKIVKRTFCAKTYRFWYVFLYSLSNTRIVHVHNVHKLTEFPYIHFLYTIL